MGFSLAHESLFVNNLINNIATDFTARPWASAFGRNQKIKERLLRIRRMFFASAFLFAASVSCEGGEKRTTAKNKRPKVPF